MECGVATEPIQYFTRALLIHNLVPMKGVLGGRIPIVVDDNYPFSLKFLTEFYRAQRLRVLRAAFAGSRRETHNPTCGHETCHQRDLDEFVSVVPMPLTLAENLSPGNAIRAACSRLRRRLHQGKIFLHVRKGVEWKKSHDSK